MKVRIAFTRCDDCAGRGYIPIRIVGLPAFGRDLFGRPSGACGGGAVRCSDVDDTIQTLIDMANSLKV
jgi:hypothetical protein